MGLLIKLIIHSLSFVIQYNKNSNKMIATKITLYVEATLIINLLL